MRCFCAAEGTPLVMTSGNRSDEPIAYQDDEAFPRLRDIADIFLSHDRPIHVRCDDSVTRVVDGLEMPLRRSRGYAPFPLRLPHACRVPILAVGGQLKNTFALGRGNEAFVSHHMGDLDEYTLCRPLAATSACIKVFLAFNRDFWLTIYTRIMPARATPSSGPATIAFPYSKFSITMRIWRVA